MLRFTHIPYRRVSGCVFLLPHWKSYHHVILPWERPRTVPSPSSCLIPSHKSSSLTSTIVYYSPASNSKLAGARKSPRFIKKWQIQLNNVSRNSNSYQSSSQLYVTADNLERVNPVWAQMNSVQRKDIKFLKQYQGKPNRGEDKQG
jgi:hypothetical protein